MGPEPYLLRPIDSYWCAALLTYEVPEPLQSIYISISVISALSGKDLLNHLPYSSNGRKIYIPHVLISQDITSYAHFYSALPYRIIDHHVFQVALGLTENRLQDRF